MLAELAAGRALTIAPIGSGIQQNIVGGGSTLAQRFNAVVRKMTALVPSARFQSIAEVGNALRLIGATA